MEVVHDFTSQVQQLKAAVSRNDSQAKSIAEKISTIFVEAQQQLQLVQEVAPSLPMPE